jgi:hypothetical protein
MTMPDGGALASSPAMSNAARPGILVHELFSGDGPHTSLADDFLTNRCTSCSRVVGRDGIYHDIGHLCTPCWARVSGLD